MRTHDDLPAYWWLILCAMCLIAIATVVRFADVIDSFSLVK